MTGPDTTGGWLDQAASKDLLRKAGVLVPRGVQAATLPELIERARDLPPPLVLRGLGQTASPARLNLATLDGQAPIPGATGYLAEVMLRGAGAELRLRLVRAAGGVALTIGPGGDQSGEEVRLDLPAPAMTVVDALRRLPLFAGLDDADPMPLCEMVDDLTALFDRDSSLTEIDLNPVLVWAHTAVAAGARVRR